jgi:hypothetical protein
VSVIERSTRLDIVVRRRDRVFEALAVALFLVIVTPLMWMILLACFWGILEQPWWSIGPGAVGTGLLIWWGVRLSRGSLARARGDGPHLVLTGRTLEIRESSTATVVPLDRVRVVAVDQPARPQRRADRVRFPVGSHGWLSCPDGSALPGVDIGFPRAPNLAVILAGPGVGGARGFVAALRDADAARAAFAARGVPVRPLEPADLDGVTTTDALPVRRIPGGLREVRDEDRLRARLFDGLAILVLFLAFAAVLAPPGRNQIPGVVAAFLLSWFIYEVPATALTGRTLGKALLGLRVVRAEDGRARVGLGRATARWWLRMVNGFVGGPAGQLAQGDALGRVAPSLSLANGTGVGTLVVADGEYHRLRALSSPEQRAVELARTVRALDDREPTASPRAAWISMLFVLVVIGATLISILNRVG